MINRNNRFFRWLHTHDGGQNVIRERGTKNIPLENRLFFPVIVEYIKDGHTVTINLRGNSMRPFLESERDRAMLSRPENLGIGDPVLAEIEPGHYVLHRIRKMEGDNVTLMGDGNLNCEYCKVSDFRAGVIGFFRKGHDKMDRTDGLKWKVYSWIWTTLRPVRRYLLAAYRYIWLNIFPLKYPKYSNEIQLDQPTDYKIKKT